MLLQNGIRGTCFALREPSRGMKMVKSLLLSCFSSCAVASFSVQVASSNIVVVVFPCSNKDSGNSNTEITEGRRTRAPNASLMPTADIHSGEFRYSGNAAFNCTQSKCALHLSPTCRETSDNMSERGAANVTGCKKTDQ